MKKIGVLIGALVLHFVITVTNAPRGLIDPLTPGPLSPKGAQRGEGRAHFKSLALAALGGEGGAQRRVRGCAIR